MLIAGTAPLSDTTTEYVRAAGARGRRAASRDVTFGAKVKSVASVMKPSPAAIVAFVSARPSTAGSGMPTASSALKRGTSTSSTVTLASRPSSATSTAPTALELSETPAPAEVRRPVITSPRAPGAMASASASEACRLSAKAGTKEPLGAWPRKATTSGRATLTPLEVDTAQSGMAPTLTLSATLAPDGKAATKPGATALYAPVELKPRGTSADGTAHCMSAAE